MAFSGCGIALVHCGTWPLDRRVNVADNFANLGAPSNIRAPLATCRVKRAPCSAVAKFPSSQLAVFVCVAFRLRSFFTSSPVLMPTGQRCAHRPVAAQVSMP
ncbi:hypothetical protein D3C85_1235020 [compost metagenome]